MGGMEDSGGLKSIRKGNSGRGEKAHLYLKWVNYSLILRQGN